VTEVAFAEYNDVVKAFPSDRTDQPFSISILPRGARRCRSIADAYRSESADKDLAIGAVPVPNEIAGSLFPPAGFRDLICDPFCGWMCSDVYGPSFVEIASDRCRGGLTGGSIPFVEFAHQLDQLLEQHRGVILAIAHDDRRDHLRLVEIDETYVVSSQASH
jgi:hypothetical protein